jgi:hypothetical protein
MCNDAHSVVVRFGLACRNARPIFPSSIESEEGRRCGPVYTSEHVSLGLTGRRPEMKTVLSTIIAICLSATAAYGSQSPTPTGQQADTKRPATQQSSPETTPQVEMKFKLVMMSNGSTKNGFAFSGMTYETANQVKVYVYLVHLGSREGAKKEYDDRLKEAVRIIEQGKIQDKPASKPPTTEDRAVIVLPSTGKDCKEMFTVLATAGTVLRIQQSCSLEAVVAWEKLANRNESVDDRFVVR